MEGIIFVHSVDCRFCVSEIRDASKKRLEKIVEERKRCRKCQNCERLIETEQYLKNCK